MPQSPGKANLVLENDGPLGRIVVDMEAFFEFSFWIAEELEDMKAMWAHKAAPNSKQIPREERIKKR